MKKLKTTWRVLKLVFLILLASVGIGLTGGVPLQITPQKERMESAVEWVISEKEESDHEECEMKLNSSHLTSK